MTSALEAVDTTGWPGISISVIKAMLRLLDMLVIENNFPAGPLVAYNWMKGTPFRVEGGPYCFTHCLAVVIYTLLCSRSRRIAVVVGTFAIVVALQS